MRKIERNSGSMDGMMERNECLRKKNIDGRADGRTNGRTVIHVELGNISEKRKLEKIKVKYNMNQ